MGWFVKWGTFCEPREGLGIGRAMVRVSGADYAKTWEVGQGIEYIKMQRRARWNRAGQGRADQGRYPSCHSR